MLLNELVDLYEIKIGPVLNALLDKEEYWVWAKDEKITVFPKSNDGMVDDLLKAYNYKNWSAVKRDKNAPEWLIKDLEYYGLTGFFYVNTDEEIVNLDITKWQKTYAARPAAKMSSYDNTTTTQYPIFGANITFNTIDVLLKHLKALVKLDSKTKN